MSNQPLEQRPWQDFLPKAFTWVDQLAVGRADALATEAWHVAGVRKDGTGLVMEAGRMPADLRDKCLAQARDLGWAGTGALKCLVDGHKFLLLAWPAVKTTPAQKARQFGQDAARALKDTVARDVILFPAADANAGDVLEGLLGGYYDTQAFRGKPEAREPLRAVSFFGEALAGTHVNERLHMVKATYVTRMLQDAPANWCHPERLAAVARDLFKGSANATVKILGPEELAKLGAGSMLAVAKGSRYPAQLIVIEIKGKSASNKTMALVGKGLTFDSGGLSIKPAAGMGEMKYDMSGGAAVLGTAYYLDKVTPPGNVVCLVGAVENAISGDAYRPGDVLQSMSGKTIEVHNTDAEGRLVLCDVLTYAQRTYKPAFVADIATLTGAVLHALGHAGAAFMTNHDEAARAVERESARLGEPFWRLPLWPELEKEVKSELADLGNIPKPSVLAGTIIGGLFLKEFLEDAATEWVHMDIAGTAWSCAATGYPESGGCAYGLRTLAGLCLTRFA